RRMTPHFGADGAMDYFNGLRHGFLGSHSFRMCGYRRADRSAQSLSRCNIIGREVGAWLRREPKRLRQILDRRCSDPFRTKSPAKIFSIEKQIEKTFNLPRGSLEISRRKFPPRRKNRVIVRRQASCSHLRERWSGLAA